MKAINYMIKDFFFRFTCFIFWLVTCPEIMGQADQKKQLKTDDYKLWSQLNPDKISSNGKWVSYNLHYKNSDADSLIVQNSDDLKNRIIFPNASDGKFNAESDFACITGDTFNLVNLNTKKYFKRNAVSSFEFSSNHKYVILFTKQTNGNLGLEIMDMYGKTLETGSYITHYSFDPNMNGLVYSTANEKQFRIEVISFDDTIVKNTIIKNSSIPFQNIIWKKDAIAFVADKINDPSLYNYDLKKKQLDSLNAANNLGFPSDMQISISGYRTPIRSDDGSKLFFWMKESLYENNKYKQGEVQVWNSKDKQLFDFQKYIPFYTWSDKMAVWNLEENKVLQITDKELPKGFLAADSRTAFIYDPVAYEPQSRQNCPYDLYEVDLKTGERSLVIKNYSAGNKPAGSPDGQNICYEKEGHWWIYNIEQKKHTCITSGSACSFFSEDSDRPGENSSYGIAGWTNDNKIVLYDKYDLWLLSLDGKFKQRLTNGRETEKSYRVKFFDIEVTHGDTETKKYILDLNKGFLMTAANKDTGATGLSYWSLRLGTKELLWGHKKVLPISKAKNKNVYMYTEQSFSLPPRLLVYDGKPKEIIQSNKHQKHYEWPKNERIEYMVNGQKVKGILSYPAGYKKDEKYPMIVYIYERQFYRLNEYENPTLFSGDGFNITNFTSQGYFVLYPDIVYEFGNLRESVTKSVLAAVDTVIQKGNVHPDKLGLIGHSFGAYETNLVITQTNRFAAAVAGSAWTDLVSAYLYIGPSFRRPDFFRTENHQLRIGKSLYEDMPSYLNNSPVLLAAGIKTPLLGWVGEDDRHIHSLQTMEFYLALRRLNKEHTLLVYPNEGHEIVTKKNQEDLSQRIIKWFDHYLKERPMENWMESNYKR